MRKHTGFLGNKQNVMVPMQVSHVTSEGGNYIHPLAGHRRPPLPPTGSKLEPSPAFKKVPGQERTSVSSLTRSPTHLKYSMASTLATK